MGYSLSNLKVKNFIKGFFYTLARFFIGLGSAILSAVVGIAVGCYAGYKGGWIDVIALRVSEIFNSYPIFLKSSILFTT